MKLVQRQRFRADREEDYGEVGRIDLAQRRRIDAVGHAPHGLRDGRLHVLGRRVDIALQHELQRDARTAVGAD
ncbi:hypothetical protein D3C83_124420 [compost metagenome]